METEHYSKSRFGECSIVNLREIRQRLSNPSSKAKYYFPKHSSGNEDLDEKCLHAARSMSITPVEDEDAEIVVVLLIQQLFVLIDQLANTDDTTTCLVNNLGTKFANIKSITAVSMKHYINCISTPSFLSVFQAVKATYVSTLSTKDNYGLLGKFIRSFRKNEWTEEVDEELMKLKCFINNLHRKHLGALFCCSVAALSSSITRVGNVKNQLHFLIQASSIETKYNRKLLQMDHLACCSVENTDITSCLVENLETKIVRMESFTKDLEMDSNIIASCINQNIHSVVLTENLHITALKSGFMYVNNIFLDKVVKPYLVLSGMVACLYFALSQKHSLSTSKNSGSISVDLWVISCIILSSKNVILLRDSTLQKKQQLYNYLFSTLQKYCEQNNDNMIYKKKSVEMLKTIIKQCDYTRNDTYFVCPAHNINLYFDNLSHELNRVGTLRQYPADNCPSLIRLAAAGFYYNGKGREVRCFSCDASYSDWSYHSIPSEVHRRISPNCEYLNERFPIDKTHILPNSTDDSQSSVENCHTSHEIGYQSSAGSVISADSCTIGNNTKQCALLTSSSQNPVLAKRSLDSGYGSSSSSTSSSYNSRTSVSTNSSTDSAYGSNSSLNQSSSVDNSDIHTDIGSRNPPLPAIAEEQQSRNGSFGATRRDSQTIPQTVPKTNTLPPKYPEYVLIERRRASFKNWPENLNFLHPLDLSECGFFYSNFGDCVRCHQCGIGLRNWESDDNPWVEHARWSRKCSYLVQRKGQDFIDSVLTVLGLQTDSEIEQAVGTPSEPLLPPKTGNATGSPPQSREDGDPLTHEAAKYVIREKIFGSNLEMVKWGMNLLLEKMDWKSITKEELVLTILEHQNGTGTEASSSAVSSNAVKKKSEKSNQYDNAPKIKQEVLETRIDTEGPNGKISKKYLNKV